MIHAGAFAQRTTIVIPSTCETRRAPGLERAIDSLLAQSRRPLVLVVANGARVDAGIVDRVRARPGVEVVLQEEGSLPKALRLGRSRVTTEYFGFLDDDDEFLPDAVAVREDVLLGDGAADVVVTNGYECVAGVDSLRVERPVDVRADPLRALLKENWLASCGGLFRASRVGVDQFDGETKHFEWTMIAYRLASTRRIVFVDVPTFRVHDSPNSLSKAHPYKAGQPEALQRIMALPGLPLDVVQGLESKLAESHHMLAASYLADGNRAKALRHHLQSLAGRQGLRYLAYSRRLLPFWPAQGPQ